MTQKKLQAKKKHHHVWANYMKRWSPNNRDVYFTTRQKKLQFHSVNGISAELDFYRVRHLTNNHIKLIKSISRLADKDLQKLHMDYLSDYLKIQHLEERYRRSNIKIKELDLQIEALKANGIENYHTAHENEVQSVLDSLADRDLSILDAGNNMINFIQFYAHQITRTKTFKNTVMLAYSKANEETELDLIKLLNESWWFIGYMFGMNIGRSLYLERKTDNHCLLLNDTNTPFITSDQPIVNVHQALTNEVKPPEDHECDHFFPISPNVAYMINKSDRFPRGTVNVSEDIVDEMNTKIARSALVNIISNSEESLKPYRKYVGTWHQKVKDSLGGKA